VERLVVMRGGGPIGIEDLPKEVVNGDPLSASHTAVQPEPSVETRTSAPIRPMGTPLAGGEAGIRYPASFGELPGDGIDLVEFIESLENDYIRQALARTNNNKNQAAKLLGLNRTTLVERIKKRKIQPLNAPSKEL